MKLKTLIQINEWISRANPDSKLHSMSEGFNKTESWDGIIEGNDWFVHVESNNWDKKQAGASVYISEDEQPVRIWMRMKTQGLRKPNDTIKGFNERIKKHMDKVARSWATTARKIHNNPELNEVGNPIPVTWKQAFREALQDPKIQSYLADCGEKSMLPVADPVNFTPRIGEGNGDTGNDGKISYSAVVLEPADQKKLLNQFGEQIPPEWRKIAHHMTITMGELPPERKRDIGTKVPLTVTELGISDKAIAVKVDGYWSNNQNPHVTLAVNDKSGGKPVDSNKITNWQRLQQQVKIKGTVMEVPVSSPV